jgi:hypothetical protein
MFKVKFKLEKESFVEASLFAYRHHLKGSPKRFLGLIFIAMSQFGVVSLLQTKQSGLLFLSSILLIYWYFLRERIRKKIYEKSFRDGHEFTLVVDESAIEINGVKLNWGDISSVIEFKDGFILQYQRESLFIPNGAFKEGQREQFISTLKAHIEKFEKVDS